VEKRQFIPLKDRTVWCVLGLAFDVVSLDDTTLAIVTEINEHRRCFLTTPNLNFVVQAQFDDAFFDSVINSDLVVADGMPIVWVARLLGIPITQRVAGSTLFDELSKHEERESKMKVFFFGGQAGVAELAHQKMNETSQGMMSCGFLDPGFVSVDEMSSSDIINKLNAADPDFLVVALGAKKGQAWLQKNRHQLNASVISHLGAVINFVAGSVERSPLVWQRLGMEWLWRIRQEPALWKRYFFDGLSFLGLLTFKVLPLALYDRWLKRSDAFKVPLNINQTQSEKGLTTISLSGSVHHTVMTSAKRSLCELASSESDVVIDCSKLSYIDGAFIGTLLLFQRYLNAGGYQLHLSNVSAKIRRILRLNNVLTRFTIIGNEQILELK